MNYRKELSMYVGKKVRVSAMFDALSIKYGIKNVCFNNCKLIDHNINIDHFWLPIQSKTKELLKAKKGDEFIIVGHIVKYKHIEKQTQEVLGINSFTIAYKIGRIVSISKKGAKND